MLDGLVRRIRRREVREFRAWVENAQNLVHLSPAGRRGGDLALERRRPPPGPPVPAAGLGDVHAVRPSTRSPPLSGDSSGASRPGWEAGAGIDFARRLVDGTGRIGVCHCIDRESQRRQAEGMLADLVAPVERIRDVDTDVAILDRNFRV